MGKMKKNIFENWPLVTIYIVSKNHEKFIEQCIKSVIFQSYKNWELYIIDDHSKDKSFKICKKYKNNKKIKLIKLSKNIGLQKIANKILTLANGKYFMRLDGDDWLDENGVINLLAKIEQRKNACAIYGSFSYVSKSGDLLGHESKSNLSNNYIAPHGACTLFKTRSLKEVGGYSENIKAQDGWEMWLKLKERGDIIYTKSNIFYYRQHHSSLTKKKNVLKERDKIFNNISNKLSGNFKPSVTAILPIKNSYEKNKNISMKIYRGKKLIDLAIEPLLKSLFISNVIVTSAVNEIKKYLQKKYKKKITFIKRPLKLNESVPLEEILYYIHKNIKKNNLLRSDIYAIANLHVLHKDKSLLQKLINVLILDRFDTVFSVVKVRDPIFSFSNNNMKILNKGRFVNLDYRNEIMYRFDGTGIVTWAESISDNGLFKKKIGFVEANEDQIIKLVK